ncbi:MAG: serine/threonine protein kinase [Gammaproteobacteria bacterium]|nr:serine/threonine protein kinase [Gammaproteobacteria bacterium]
MSNDNNTPYANLDPNVILDAIESLGFQCNGNLLALNSYENRVYQIGIEDAKPIVAKFYRPERWSDAAILEEHQFSEELFEHEIPVIAPIKINDKTLHCFNEFRFAVFSCQGGHALELDNIEQLEWMGRFIGRLHAVSACNPFRHRTELNVQNMGYASFNYLRNNSFIPFEIETNYCQVIETLLKQIEESFERVGEINYIRLHGDIHAGNVLWNNAGPHIVDLDDCIMGPAIQDIWMLLSGDAPQTENELERILTGYNTFYEFHPQELHLIEPLRSLRMLNYSAWLARRWDDPAFPKSFPWFDTPKYWQEQLQNFRTQSELLVRAI